jgi:flagellar motility protein MotE (MotC chaperone)
MICGSLRNAEILPLAGLRIAASTWLFGALLAASSALTPVVAQPAWTASVETQAETAYRAIHARSLAKPKPAVKYARRKRAVAAPLHTGAIIPTLPTRKTQAPAEAAGADKPASEVLATDAPNAQPQVEENALIAPLIRKPNGLAEVLTTQVLPEEQETAVPADAKATPQTTGDQYCSSISNAAADARFAWQKQALQDTEKQVEKRVEELNAKIAEYQKWMARRDDFSRKAQSSITDIYAKMKPDAAAQQLTALDEETAAAVIAKLSPKISSALMAEMDAKKAARLTAIIAGSSKGPKGKPPAQPPGSGGT